MKKPVGPERARPAPEGRPQVQPTLSESEQRFRSAFDDGAVAMALVAPDMRVLQVNPAYCRLLGYTEAELVGRDVQDWTHPEDRTLSRLSLDSVVTRGATTLRLEKRYITRDGRTVSVDISSAPVRDSGGRFMYVVSHVQDITERRLAELKLRESEERFRTIASRTPDHLLEQDLDLRYTLVVNPQLGLTEQDMLGKSDYDFLAQEDADRLTEIKRKVMATGESFHVETSLMSRGGTPEYFAGTYVPKFDSTGKVVGLLGYFQNITERRRAEDALRESEERYRNLFETMEEGFCIIQMVFDAQGKPVDYRFLKINPAFERQTGLHDAEGKLMLSLAPDHETFWFETYGKVALTGEPQRFVNEARALNRWYDAYAYRIGRPEDRQVAILFNDISAAKRAEAEVRRRVEELSAANEELSRFNRLAVDRELRMVELKQEIDDLLRKTGQTPKYGTGKE